MLEFKSNNKVFPRILSLETESAYFQIVSLHKISVIGFLYIFALQWKTRSNFSVDNANFKALDIDDSICIKLVIDFALNLIT